MTIHKFEHLGIPDEVTQDNTKKLNESSRNTRERLAGIALVCLGSYLDDEMVTQEQLNRIFPLAQRCMNTSVLIEGEGCDAEYIEQAIAYLEEYIKEQGV